MKWFLSLGLLAAMLAGGCGKNESAVSTPASSKLTLQLNWKPEPEFGGFYAAQIEGAFKKHNVDVDIVAGGIGAPTAQMIAAGKAQFGIVSADEIIIARASGADIVGLFAVYQTNPQGLMTHAARGLGSIADIFSHDGVVAIQKGLTYAVFLERKYGFGKVRIVPTPGGDLSAFRSDPNFTTQCFVTSEPLAAKRAGLDPQTFLVAESGYNPYTTVLATSGAFIKSNPKAVKETVAAVLEGWQSYMSDSTKTNDEMAKLNPTMDRATFTESAGSQKPLIMAEDAKGADIGRMSVERWKTLVGQLVDLKVIDKPVAAEDCFIDVTKLP